MLQIDDTVISLDLLKENFVCDLIKCKGECCVEGDAGAPLELEEIDKINEVLPLVWDKLSDKAKALIKLQGVSYIDEDGEPVTSIINGRECVFTYFDENGICKCALENHYKPISCYLYPVRIQKYETFSAVNYHRWSVCNCAVDNGNALKVPVYKFLKAPLTRKFGEEWYEQLELAAHDLKEYLESDESRNNNDR